MLRWLHLRLAAPLMSFGGVAIDQVGPTRALPSASAITGLLANALGWDRTQARDHQALQDRLILASVIAQQGTRITDSQNAKLEKSDKGWTTRGMPEGRAGATYNSPHRRRRDYLADHDVHVVLALDGDGVPTLDELARALNRPARPLFIGRKPCLPAAPILAGELTAKSAFAALESLCINGPAQWPLSDSDLPEGARSEALPDIRNWRTGLHAGTREVVYGRIGDSP